MKHIVLLGDSIFDNAAYVEGGPDVITQLNPFCPKAGKQLCWPLMEAFQLTLLGKFARFLNWQRIWSSVLGETMGLPGRMFFNGQQPQWPEQSNNWQRFGPSSRTSIARC